MLNVIEDPTVRRLEDWTHSPDLSLNALLFDMTALRGVAPQTLKHLADGAELRDLERGAQVFTRGSNPTGLYFIVSGGVKLMSLGPDNRGRVVELFEPRGVFGDIGVFTGAPYRTWTETRVPTRLIHVCRTRVLEAVDQDHRFAVRMLNAVAARTQRLIDSFSCAAPSAAAVRVAAYLLELADRAPLPGTALVLPATKGTIASLLNLTQESLSRALRRMMDAGLLKVTGRRIQIRDRQGLVDLMDHRSTPAESI